MKNLCLLSALLGVWGCSGDSNTREIVFHGEQPLLPGWSYDTGLQPASSPVQVQLAFTASGAITADAHALAGGEDESLVVAATPGSGKFAVGGKFALTGMLHVDVSGFRYDGPIPGLDNVDASLAAETAFDPFLIGDMASVTAELPEIALPPIPLPGGIPGNLQITIASGSTISSELSGDCASMDPDALTASYLATTRTSGKLIVKSKVVIMVPVVGDRTFDIPTFNIDIPAASATMDLGVHEFASGGDIPEGDSLATRGACDGGGGPGGGGGGGGGGSMAVCPAQRVVHLVGGNGGFAWFTQIWPAPEVITEWTSVYAFDDPSNAIEVVIGAHQLFARRVPGGLRAVWEGPGRGRTPQVTAMMAGANETHTVQPSSIVMSGGRGIDAVAATIQAGLLAPKIPALTFGVAGPFGAFTGSANVLNTTDVDGAISLLRGLGVSQAVLAELPPSPQQIASYIVDAGGSANERALAMQLAFIANAMRHGLIGTATLPAFNDDPHAAFVGTTATTKSDRLAQLLDAFYADLATMQDPACNGTATLADNVVLIVNGDTMKNALNRTAWPDGTPNNTNAVYVRSNGYLVPGWFGGIDAAGTTGIGFGWDPTTGNRAPYNGTTTARSAWAAMLYAITRGDAARVSQFTTAPYAATVAQ
jgi:hypothetical protein